MSRRVTDALTHWPSIKVLDQDDGKRDVRGWHSDFPYLWGSPHRVGGDRVPTGKPAELVMGVQRNICISEFTRANGATCFKLGTHALNVAVLQIEVEVRMRYREMRRDDIAGSIRVE